MKRTDFDDFAHSYDQVLARSLEGFGADIGYYHRYKIRMAQAMLKAQPRRVLEYGCGAGTNLGLLAQAFPDAHVAGCDVSAESLRVAGERHPEAALYDLGAGESPPGTYDFIFISNVLHHVPPAERAGVMERVAALLAFSGELFIFEHNPKNPLTRRVVRDCPLDADAVLLDLNECAALVRAAGLRVVRSRYALFFPAVFKYLIFLEPLLARLPLGAQHCLQAAKDDGPCQTP